MIANIRAALLIALLAGIIPAVAEAQNASSDSLVQRIVFLESRVAELEQRLRALEGLFKAEPAQARPAPVSATWRDQANWRRLRRGMTVEQVRAILGEPDKVDATSIRTTWTWGDYPERASLYFDNDKLAGWSEPGS